MLPNDSGSFSVCEASAAFFLSSVCPLNIFSQAEADSYAPCVSVWTHPSTDCWGPYIRETGVSQRNLGNLGERRYLLGELQVTKKVYLSLEKGFKVSLDIFVKLKLNKPCYKCQGKRKGEELHSSENGSGYWSSALARGFHNESGEGRKRGVGLLVSGDVTLALNPWELAFIFTFHVLFTETKSSRAKEKWAQDLQAAVCGSAVCGSAVRCPYLSLPKGIALTRNLWDICCLVCLSGNIYLFINLFYEDCTGHMVQILTDQSLFFKFTNHDLMGNTTL